MTTKVQIIDKALVTAPSLVGTVPVVAVYVMLVEWCLTVSKPGYVYNKLSSTN